MQFERNIVFWVAALTVLVALLWLLSPILLPFVLGMAIAYVLDPLANQLSKRGVSRLLAAVLILGGFVVALALLVLLIAPVLAQQLSAFIDNVPVYALRLQGFVSDPSHPWIKRIIGDNLTGADKSVGDLMNQTVGYLTGLLASLWAKGQALISIFSLLIITPVVAFYLICDWDRMLAAIDRLVPVPQREIVRRLGREIDATIAAYVRGQSGLDPWLVLCDGAHLCRLEFRAVDRRDIGPDQFSLGRLAQFAPDWTRVVIVAGIVLFGQFLEGNVLAPKLVGKSVGLHPVWLIFALFAFGYLFGFVGLLLAVPLAAGAGVLIRFALARYFASPLYTGNRPP
jgi:predicted PurR-regulated permease PerM